MTSSTQLHIHEKIEQLQQEIVSSWPEILDYIQPLSSSHTTSEPSPIVESATEEKAITQEDRLEVLEQLRALSILPPTTLEATQVTALARQLGFVINASVSFELDNNQLLNSHGRVQLQQSPGNLNTLWSATTESTCSLFVSPRQLDSNILTQTPWFFGKRVLVINTTQMIGVVARIAGVQTTALHRAQFSASSQLMRAGQFWQPGNQGRVIVLFLDNTLAEGTVLDLTQGDR